MSLRRVTMLVTAGVCTLSLIFLTVLVAFDEAVGHHPAFWLLALGLSAATASFWISYETASAGERVKRHIDRRVAESSAEAYGRVDEIAGQLAAVAELVADFGDGREASGYLAGASSSQGNVRQLR